MADDMNEGGNAEELRQLRALALATGTSPDLQDDCGTFLAALTARGDPGAAAVWIDARQLDGAAPRSYRLFAGAPDLDAAGRVLAFDHPAASRLRAEGRLFLSGDDPGFTDLACGTTPASGACLVRRLGACGFLVLHGLQDGEDGAARTDDRLADLLDLFTLALEGGLALGGLRRELDARQRSEQVLRRRLADLNHEVRTPLNGIIGMADLLGRVDLGERNGYMVDVIRRSSRSLLAILDGLADLATIASHGAAPDAALPGVPASGVLAGARILVADDNEYNRIVMEMMLGDWGCTVLMAADGEQAVAAVARGGVDAVLMDVQMPGIDGLEATRRIRALGGPCARTPVIAATAHALPADRDRCLAAGMNRYVAKPVEAEALRSALTELLAPDAAPYLEPDASFGAAIARKLAPRFGEDTARRIGVLRALAAAGDADAIRDEAHAIAGAAATIGAKRVEEIARRLMARAPAAGHGDPAQAIAELEAALAVTMDLLQADGDDA